jgi:uncharacterized protein YbjT (DUF2867 family)
MIAVAGGTGAMGRVLVARLLERGLPVRVLTRDPSHLPASLAGRVEVTVCDVREPASLGPALTGVRTLVSAIQGFGGPGAAGAPAIDRDGNLALISAAEAAGVEHVVLLSIADAAADHPIELFRCKFAAEQRLRAGPLAWTIIRPTAYMETWVALLGRPLVETGRTRVFGRGRNPVNFVSSHDVARMVEEAVVDPGLRGETVEAVGPEDLTFDDIVHVVERETGVSGKISHAPVPMLRIGALIMGRVDPVLAAQIRAAIVMDGRDMRVGPARVAERLARFPAIPATRIDEVVRRELGETVRRPSGAEVTAG